MIRSKFVTTLTLGICLTAMSSGIALANQGGLDPSALPVQIEQQQSIIDSNHSIEILEMQGAPDDPIAYSVENMKIDEDILQKQSDIDKYLFQDHAEEIKEKGFTVTHTEPFENYVEIGITPYTEENAKYLLDIFGEENVRVIEGQQAEIYKTSVESDGVEADVVMAEAEDDEAESNSTKSPFLYGLGGVILLGGGIFAKRKLAK